MRADRINKYVKASERKLPCNGIVRDSIRKKKNTYSFEGNVGTCITEDGTSFIFDKEDFDKIEPYTWKINYKGYVRNASLGAFHRFILDYPDSCVDHINRIKTDNRKSNLRICTYQENARNREQQKNNRSGYKGVCFDKSRNKYVAKIKVGSKHYYIGRFDTAKEAAYAYDRKAIELHGEFAYTNFPKENYEKEVEKQ